ncbi:unnamed protein product [Fusarium venenatum]|uniref:Uncharacterized protein n=1 Tax=Fusarium venenatum TaxID=56646 RepID=A0A2L2TEB2_9HYPO|nr:uncharacterized protein FVRRES_02885 [Fusarium venenatum]CEI66373.1 unnamed protein product [Fusarium venenatum]
MQAVLHKHRTLSGTFPNVVFSCPIARYPSFWTAWMWSHRAAPLKQYVLVSVKLPMDDMVDVLPALQADVGAEAQTNILILINKG